MIWTYAADHGFTVVSKDDDFRQRAYLYGAPPKVVWLRVGNSATSDVAAIIERHQHAILAFGADGDSALLVVSQ